MHSWRHDLDPRDPEYLEPPTEEEQARNAETEEFFAEAAE